LSKKNFMGGFVKGIRALPLFIIPFASLIILDNAHGQNSKISAVTSISLQTNDILAYDLCETEEKIYICVTNFNKNIINVFEFTDDSLKQIAGIKSPWIFAYKKPVQILQGKNNCLDLYWEVAKDKNMAVLLLQNLCTGNGSIEELLSYPANKYFDLMIVPSGKDEGYLSYADISDRQFVFNIGHDLFQGYLKHYLLPLSNLCSERRINIQKRGKYHVQGVNGIKYNQDLDGLYTIWVDDYGCYNKGDNVWFACLNEKGWKIRKKIFARKYKQTHSPMASPLKLISNDKCFVAFWESSINLPSNNMVQFIKINKNDYTVDRTDSLNRRTLFGDAVIDETGKIHCFVFSDKKEYIVINEDGSKNIQQINNNPKSFGFVGPRITVAVDGVLCVFWLSHEKESDNKYISYFKVHP